MDGLLKIKAPVAAEFGCYERYMEDALRSDSDYVGHIIDYVVANRGKGIRPMMVLLMAGLHSGGRIGERAYLAAMLVEMIHNASLVHDDVVDDAQVRHGKPSVNSKWNSRVSILTGDFILARSFKAGMNSGHYDIVSYVTSGVADLAEGELIQIDINSRKVMTRQDYLDIIFKKTATLLGVSCGAGAMAAGAPAEDTARARQVGLDLGMAFQIKDDILDYAPEEQTGKPFCADLREKKVTLPLLAILERSDDLTRRLIMQKVDCLDKSPDEIYAIHDFVVKEGGIAAAEEVMHEYLDRARATVGAYPESEYRTSFLGLCDYIGKRSK